MVNYVPLSHAEHASKGWLHPTSMLFAAKVSIVPVALMEFNLVAMTMPVGFIREADRYVPVAVLSPMPDQNWFVGPVGQWLGGYVPAALRTYPFRLARVQDRDEMVLCVDIDSGLIVEAGSNTEPLFGADGKASASIQAIGQFLQQYEVSRKQSDDAVAALADAGVVQPWQLSLKIDGQPRTIEGLFRIDETALNALSDEAFLKLRKVPAIPIAYLQLFSMIQTGIFERLSEVQKKLAPSVQKVPGSLDDIFSKMGDTIKFS